jgi:hypothetical protein
MADQSGTKNRTTLKTMNEIDSATLNLRLLANHRLLTTVIGGTIVKCEVEFLGDIVSPSLFNTYLANGMIEVPKDGVGYKLSADGRKRIKGMSRSG